MYRPKHVEWTCREINSLHIVASVGHSTEIIYLDSSISGITHLSDLVTRCSNSWVATFRRTIFFSSYQLMDPSAFRFVTENFLIYFSMQNYFWSFYISSQIEFLQTKHKSCPVRVVTGCNGKIMDTLEPSTESHVMEPTEGTVLTDSVLDPSQCTPSQPIHISGASVAQVRL